jgi:hypothetical protein
MRSAKGSSHVTLTTVEAGRRSHYICQDNHKGLFITGTARRQTQSTQTSAEY